MDEQNTGTPREFLIELGHNGRVFEITGGKIFIEYKGKPPINTMKVVDLKSYEIIKDINGALSNSLSAATICVSNITKEFQVVLSENDKLRKQVKKLKPRSK